MFDKNKFALILKNISEKYENQRDFAKKSEINRTYLSQYMNMKLDEPPQPKILQKLADASIGITTYDELMTICGYYEESLEKIAYTTYQNAKKLCEHIYKDNNDDHYEVDSALETFKDYIVDFENTKSKENQEQLFLSRYFQEEFFLEDYNFAVVFLYIYDSLLNCLLKERYIAILNYDFINWFKFDEIYSNLSKMLNLELLSYNSSKIKVINEFSDKILSYIKQFFTFLNLSFLSDFDNNKLIEKFKQNVNKSTKKIETISNIYTINAFNCPVYGRISAGQPNWAEECLEGYLPIDPNLMNIVNPEECFFLRVNGESMNKVIRNGAYALIRKQDIVENGEIAAVLVNGFDATLKKFTQHNDVIVLEPLSDDSSFQTQIYDKNTEIKILGKYIGKFEINN